MLYFAKNSWWGINSIIKAKDEVGFAGAFYTVVVRNSSGIILYNDVAFYLLLWVIHGEGANFREFLKLPVQYVVIKHMILGGGRGWPVL